VFTFHSIKELINTLAWAKELLTEMFEKRKVINYKFEHALELLPEERLQSLLEKGILRQNNSCLEIDDQFLEFFEDILEVNEEINTAYIHESISIVKQNIIYYLQEPHEHRKYSYLKKIKTVLRKTGRIILRNIVDLNRNIDNTFKAEPNYKIKISKLENYDRKRLDISLLIDQTENLVTEEEQTFFRAALDDDLKQVIVNLRMDLHMARHNLVEVQRQVIDYLNKIKHLNSTFERIRQIKYLKDQFELKSKTNFIEILTQENTLTFEPAPQYPLKPSLIQLEDDSSFEIIQKVCKRLKLGNRPVLPIAGEISEVDLNEETEEEFVIDFDQLKNSFLASGNHLFNFILNYQYPGDLLFEEKVTLFCQIVSLYENELNVTDNFQVKENIEYALVYPK
jgi:hypothetical protein